MFGVSHICTQIVKRRKLHKSFITGFEFFRKLTSSDSESNMKQKNKLQFKFLPLASRRELLFAFGVIHMQKKFLESK